MPIEVRFRTTELDVPLRTIYPNDPERVHGLFTDHCSPNPYFVIVRCTDDDLGGYVYTTPTAESGLFGPELQDADARRNNLEVIIGPHGYYERSITSKQGMGRLLLRHFT